MQDYSPILSKTLIQHDLSLDGGVWFERCSKIAVFVLAYYTTHPTCTLRGTFGGGRSITLPLTTMVVF